MGQLLLLIVAGCQVLIFQTDLINALLPLANDTHHIALQWIQQNDSPWNWLYAAIVLGHDEGIRHLPMVASFITLGLYHLIVVSGGHINALEFIVEKVTTPFPTWARKTLTLTTLSIFTFANRLQAACMRASLSWIVKILFPFKCPEDQFFCGALCLLILQPSWVHSLSFQLSCGASLALVCSRQFQMPQKIFQQFLTTLLVTLFIAPLLFRIQPCQSWLTLASNTLIKTPFEIFLFPAALLASIIPIFKPLVDPVLLLIQNSTGSIAQFAEPHLCLESEVGPWGFPYVSCLYFSWRLVLPHAARKTFWSKQTPPVPTSYFPM